MLVAGMGCTMIAASVDATDTLLNAVTSVHVFITEIELSQLMMK